MPVIEFTLPVKAPAARCFDLARSIDLHMISTRQTGEKAIAGITSGLIGLGETVTWRARHFGIWQTLTSKITAFDRPHYFVDEQVQGAFESFYHEHHFETRGPTTLMHDRFSYQSPLGPLGKLADVLFLKAYMEQLLLKRNEVIKAYAESEKWKALL